MKKFLKIVWVTLAVLLVIWGFLTLYVEMEGADRQSQFGDSTSVLKALIVYDADPFYNLDEQVSESFARGLAAKGWHVQVMTVPPAKHINTKQFNLYVFCANTYNWSPDWAITRFIKKHSPISGKNVAAITVGAGATKRSMGRLENLIKQKGGNLIESETYWLWRPNDESQPKISNVKAAVEMAENYGTIVADKLMVTQK